MTEPKTLMDLGRRECRYAIGEDEDGAYLFCAEVTAVNRSFCPKHHARCFVPIQRIGKPAQKENYAVRKSAFAMRLES